MRQAKQQSENHVNFSSHVTLPHSGWHFEWPTPKPFLSLSVCCLLLLLLLLVVVVVVGQAVQGLTNHQALDMASPPPSDQKSMDRALCEAAKQGDHHQVQVLLESNANVNATIGFLRKSPLRSACLNGHQQAVSLLLAHAANVNQKDAYLHDPLHLACSGGHTEIVDILLEHAANVNQLDKHTTSALHVACRYGNQHMVKALLDHAANVTNDALLHLACQYGHQAIAEIALDRRANVNQLHHDSNTALHTACYGSHQQLAMMLVDFGADINIVNVCALSLTVSLFACRRD
jgi:ankyrin repeat protein